MDVKRALLCLVFAVGALLLPPAHPALGHVQDPEDEILKAIGVDEKPGAPVPLDLSFSDPEGKTVRLGDYFRGGPVILTLNYYTCPMLCPLILRNLLTAAGSIRGIALAGDFRIVTVSIDPDETIEAARARSNELHGLMKGIRDPAGRWAFLRGDRETIGKLTSAVGFRYRKAGKEFAHPNVIVVLTPEGKISRYLYGIEQEPKDLKLALIEATGGKIGASTIMNRALLYCFHYDPVGRKYSLYARNIMKAGGVLTLVFLLALYLALGWKRKRGSLTGGA